MTSLSLERNNVAIIDDTTSNMTCDDDKHNEKSIDEVLNAPEDTTIGIDKLNTSITTRTTTCTTTDHIHKMLTTMNTELNKNSNNNNTNTNENNNNNDSNGTMGTDLLSVSSSSSSSSLLSSTNVSSSTVSNIPSQQQQQQPQQKQKTQQHRRSSMKSKKKKNRKQNTTVSFNNTVCVRNHVHVSELTYEEKSATWFRPLEYHTIHQNNSTIIRSIGKKQKSNNKQLSFKKNKNNKRKSFQKQNIRQNNEECIDEHDVDIDEEEERRGYSIRGLENETVPLRRLRDNIYYQGKLIVLSIQDDLADHIEALKKEFRNKKNQKTKQQDQQNQKKKKKTSSRTTCTSSTRTTSNTCHRDMTLTTKFQYVSEQYCCEFSELMATQYQEICQPHHQEARERGIRDEQTARKLNRNNNNNNNKIDGSQCESLSLSSVEGIVDINNEDQRRSSTTSTTSTVETVGLDVDEDESKNIHNKITTTTTSTSSSSGMKLAKKFLRKVSLTTNNDNQNRKNKNKTKNIKNI